MNQNDINRAFTEKVAELLSRGYQIYPGTMNGSQGEIAHVDLYRGDEIIRVLLDHSAGHGQKPDGVRLIVGRNTDRIRMNCFDKLILAARMGFSERTVSHLPRLDFVGEYSTEKTADKRTPRRPCSKSRQGR